MKLKLLLFVLLLVAGGFIYLGLKKTPNIPHVTEIALKREQFLP